MDHRNHTILKSLLYRLFLAAALTAPAAAQGAETFDDRVRGLFRDEAPPAARETILPVDEAFRFSASVSGPDRLSLFWQIAEGYYLYRDRFSFHVLRGDARIDAGAVDIPRGKVKQDESFGRVEVNTGEVTVELPLRRREARRAEPIVLQVNYQGCKEETVCYPPVSREVAMTLTAAPAD